jgi:hypothetical protein
VEARDALGAGAGLNVDVGFGGEGIRSLFDDGEFGLDYFEGEGMDGVFAMPPVFPYDLSVFFR